MKYKKVNDELILTIDSKYHHHPISDIFHDLHLSKKTIHLLRQYKQYRLNGQYVDIQTAVSANDELAIKAYEHGIDFIPQPVDLDIIYEDEILCIVSKPAHTIIYPETKEGKDTLCNYVAWHYLQTHQDYPVRALHRLDRDTTGLVMFCKCQLLQPCFDELISSKKLSKHYLAWIEGHLDHSPLTISKPIGNDRHHKQKMIISKTGKNAMTHVKQLKQKQGYSLVECQIETGRKHQIRLHLSTISHPILADELYGKKSRYISRLALHAWRLQFSHPLTNKKMDIICDIPVDMKKLL